jgi:hypothetical protein
MFELDCRGRGLALGGLALFALIGCSSEDGTPGGVGGIEAQGPNESAGARDKATAQQALVNETCYELRAHGPGPRPGPGTPVVIPPGELYVEMAYEVPWSVPMVATRFVTELDNAQVVHDWALYRAAPAGAFPGSVQAVFGNQIEKALLASWTPGDPPLEMPPGVGLELPPPNSMLTVHWNYVSSTHYETDASVVKICAVPAGTLAHNASVTVLGTEDLFIMPGWPAIGSCTNYSSGPVTVFLSRPRMYELGVNAQSVVHRSNQPPNVVFDEPYNFFNQRYYETNYTLGPGDTIESTCTYDPSQFPWTEVCYHYTYSYPAGALGSPGSWNNTCFW